MARVDADTGRVSPWEGDTMFHGVFRRQELPPAYVPDGAVTIVTYSALFRRLAGAGEGPHAFLGLDRRAVISPEGSVIDIDSPLDVLVADRTLKGSSGT